jgi:hypothetical protein
MWKNCQAFRARYESVLSDSTRPPSLYPQRILADFWAGLGILIIEGKNKKGSATRLGLSLSGTHEHASLQSAAGYWLPATRSLRSFHPRPSSAEVLSIQMRRQFLVCFQIHPCHFLANPPIPSRPPAQKPAASRLSSGGCHSPKQPSCKPRRCNNLPQSHTLGGWPPERGKRHASSGARAGAENQFIFPEIGRASRFSGWASVLKTVLCKSMRSGSARSR